MYAIVKCGGKQLKVQKGDVVRVERMECEAGETITLDQVLLVADGDKVSVGTPLVSGAAVTATVKEQIRDKKVLIFKKKRRHNYRRKKGHRQYLTVIEVTDIKASGASSSSGEKKAPKADGEKTAKPAAKKAG